jgi:CheY-like chemotaxis protein
MINFKGHDVVGIASDGPECLEKIQDLPQQPDFIILDYRMPLMNGLDTTKQLLKLNSNLKIIILSADSTVKSSALDAGAVAFFSKPVSMDDLFYEIEKV